MSIAQIREQIEELSYEERVELSEWLQITTPVEDDDAYYEALAEKRSEELRTGKARLLSEEEFWAGVELAKQQRRAS
jgi:hypothetical protein